MTHGIVEFVLKASAAGVLSGVGAVMRAGVAPGLFVTVCDDGLLQLDHCSFRGEAVEPYSWWKCWCPGWCWICFLGCQLVWADHPGTQLGNDDSETSNIFMSLTVFRLRTVLASCLFDQSLKVNTGNSVQVIVSLYLFTFTDLSEKVMVILLDV